MVCNIAVAVAATNQSSPFNEHLVLMSAVWIDLRFQLPTFIKYGTDTIFILFLLIVMFFI